MYSETTRCQDCYKCIRECPVKAIRVFNSQASILPQYCIVCGHCASVCPNGAKKVRDDLGLARDILSKKKRVIASLAPSFASEFSGLKKEKLIRAIKMLGFSDVSETALGAQQVSAQVAMDLSSAAQPRLFLSSACPVAVEFIGKYIPEHTHSITKVLSPLLSHCKLLKERFGDDAGVVFFGPCIAKKLEAAAHPELLDVALTFEDLRHWLDEREIDPSELTADATDRFMPEAASEGALYPIEGGMADATRVNCPNADVRFVSLSGIDNIEIALRQFDSDLMNHNVFLELLACAGGCVNGPKSRTQSPVASRLEVLDYAHYAADIYPRVPEVAILDSPRIKPVDLLQFSDKQIEETLLSIGKQSSDDELNCGGCGYHSCRELASAILSGKGEPSMCASYMRNLAHKKANAILHTAPYAIVLVNDVLNIIECNREFIRLGGDDIEQLSKVLPTLEGVELSNILPFADLFSGVLNDGQDVIRKYIRFDDTVLSVTIFTLEPHRVVGAMLIDVTSTEIRREQIVEKAQQVIKNTLNNVQDIAFRLGKSAAESELILNSIVDGFSATHYDQDKAKTE